MDAGCGDGYFSIAASPMVGEEGRVYAVDSDGVAIAELKSKLAALRITNLEAHVADISKGLPLADKSVNSVLLANVLHGLVANGEEEGALREMARVVSPGGKLLGLGIQ